MPKSKYAYVYSVPYPVEKHGYIIDIVPVVDGKDAAFFYRRLYKYDEIYQLSGRPARIWTNVRYHLGET